MLFSMMVFQNQYNSLPKSFHTTGWNVRVRHLGVNMESLFDLDYRYPNHWRFHACSQRQHL